MGILEEAKVAWAEQRTNVYTQNRQSYDKWARSIEKQLNVILGMGRYRICDYATALELYPNGTLYTAVVDIDSIMITVHLRHDMMDNGLGINWKCPKCGGYANESAGSPFNIPFSDLVVLGQLLEMIEGHKC